MQRALTVHKLPHGFLFVAVQQAGDAVQVTLKLLNIAKHTNLHGRQRLVRVLLCVDVVGVVRFAGLPVVSRGVCNVHTGYTLLHHSLRNRQADMPLETLTQLWRWCGGGGVWSVQKGRTAVQWLMHQHLPQHH